MNDTLRLPAEWEAVDAILMAWPHSDTDWNYILDDVRQCYARIIAAVAPRAKVILIGPEEPAAEYLPEGDDRLNVIYINIPTNDTWTRDYGPITTIDETGALTANDFKFNGWGLKFAADRDNLATSELFSTGIFSSRRLNRLGFVLEGGAIESDGHGTIITTRHCMMSPNRNGDMSEHQIEEYLRKSLGADRILWLGHGSLEGDDTDGHIDTLARLAPPGDVIFYTGCPDADDSHHEPLALMKKDLEALTTADGKPYHLVELPLPDAIHDPDDGHRLPATYANFLIVNGAVILPVYGQPMKDLMAKMAIQTAMPDYDIIPVDCRALIRQHGSLHCATMQLPYNSLSTVS
ncbi:MAG: agmatine deiminase family protein [Muribaculaceae bacterium]|nr:agmatine deiminase family protein [Muribaculaceae bacterium]